MHVMDFCDCKQIKRWENTRSTKCRVLVSKSTSAEVKGPHHLHPVGGKSRAMIIIATLVAIRGTTTSAFIRGLVTGLRNPDVSIKWVCLKETHYKQ